MRLAAVALAATLGLLALAATAAAKEVTAVTVCGAHACTRLTDRASLDAFMHAGGMAEEAPSTPQRSYLLRVRISEPGSDDVYNWTSRWLPDAGLIASHDDSAGLLFTGVDAPLDRILRRAVRGHAARPARRFVRREPAARVDEVVQPPASPPKPAAADAGGSLSPAWAGAGAALLLLAAAGASVGAVRVRRLRRG
jgi:hypothetical protein